MVADALRALEEQGGEVAAALLAGGVEKLPTDGIPVYGGYELRAGGDPRALLDQALAELAPDAVLDLSDEPVLDYRRRHELAAIALYHGVPYEGADFRFSPPPRPALCRRPSLAVIGTGKRTGKTAVAGFAARTLKAAGLAPVVVAMGRGGPPEPEVLRGDEVELTPNDLIAFADQGKHAASDYIEDALLARVPTVGCRRCGGGLAGAVGRSNVAAGIELANALPGDLLLLEGSGAALPPAHADAVVLVVPANVPLEYLAGYMGPYRLLLADAVVVTMCEEPFGSASQVSTIRARIEDTFRPVERGPGEQRELRVVRTVFRPTPARSVAGASVVVATTAPEAAGAAISRHLEERYDCRVVGTSHSLSNRSRLMEELSALPKADVLLCEVKAAAIDVAARWALSGGLDVVFMDNEPVGVEGDDPVELILAAGDLAAGRFARSTPNEGRA